MDNPSLKRRLFLACPFLAPLFGQVNAPPPARTTHQTIVFEGKEILVTMKDGQIQSINKYEPGIWVINAGIYKRNDTEIVLHDWPKPGTISVYFNGLRLMPGEDFIVVEHSVWIQKIDALIVNKANIIIDYMV